ncbi:Short-chain dehydrogenase/reductase SDR, partial [Macrophomina phaseolina MS6]
MTSRTEFGHDTKATEVADAFPNQIKDRVGKAPVNNLKPHMLTVVHSAYHRRFQRRARCPSLLILVSRTKAKIDAVIEDIKAINPAVTAKAVLVDLSSQAAVRKAAEEIKALTPRIDLLINNAGMTVLKRSYSAEGIESQLAANHLGPFLLTNLLRDQLFEAAKHSAPGATRVVNVSSEGHRTSPFRFHDYNNEGWPIPAEEAGTTYQLPDWAKEPVDGYVGMQAYAQSKTANILFSVGLNKRLADKGVVSYALHPGAIFTEMSRGYGNKLNDINQFLSSLNPKPSNDEGSSTTLVAALDPALN